MALMHHVRPLRAQAASLLGSPRTHIVRHWIIWHRHVHLSPVVLKRDNPFEKNAAHARASAKQRAFDEFEVRREARRAVAGGGDAGTGAVDSLMEGLRGEAAEKLGAQEHSILSGLKKMAGLKQQIDADNTSGGRLEALAREFNGIRRDVLKTRNNLMVQREALGFRVGNVDAVLSQYDIPAPLDVLGRELGVGDRGPGRVPLPQGVEARKSRSAETGQLRDDTRPRTPIRPPRRY